MPRRILAAAKIPQDLYNMLDQRVRDEGKSRSRIITDAIAQYLNQPCNQELTLASLARELDSVKKVLVDVESLKSEIALLHQKIINLKQEKQIMDKQVPSSYPVNDQYPPESLVNRPHDYRSMVNQFLNRQRLGKQSSKAKFLNEFVKYLESQD